MIIIAVLLLLLGLKFGFWAALAVLVAMNIIYWAWASIFSVED
jgi:hypothetical protein